ncbi:glycerophosphodiester phosphodiesterase family protein [Lachnospira multipara]|uniref:glycerophosphodiester phosphodiesterase family protein n=1 Tax=Lachnospira multipara TaxID=28051 RepID=UPI0009DF617F|nr:glycerophosphodiester phosphodiesterase family protein [Lachnospira multipara]
MISNIRNSLKLLKSSGGNILRFELVFKLGAIAVTVPLLTFILLLGMKFAKISYLTNGYIIKALTNPFVIILILLSIGLLITYCIFEMSYLSVAFETGRRGYEASIKDCLYNAYKRVKMNFKIKHFPLFFVYLFAIAFINVVVFINMVFTETNKTLFRVHIIGGSWYIKLFLILGIAIIYVLVISGIFTANIHILEEKKFRESFKLSCKLVKKNLGKVLLNIIVYNLIVALIFGLVYLFITIVLVVGVRILDRAYIGSTLYLSALRTIKAIFNIVWTLIAVPLSYSLISTMYYSLVDTDYISFDYVDIEEGSDRKNELIYRIILSISTILCVLYVALSFNDNPFERVAIFHSTQVTAHRGNSVDAPENTLAAFRAAIDDMADCIELDIQMTSDGVLVVMHDPSLYRTTGLDKKVTEVTYDEISKLDAGSWYSDEFKGEKVPTLEEVLELVQGKIDLNIEIKTNNTRYEIAKELVDLLAKYNMENRVVVTSFDYKSLKAVKGFNSNIQVGYILSMAYGDFYNMQDVDFFSVNASFLSKRTVDAIHNSGKMVYAWTVNSSESAINLTNKGVDCLITDNPVMIKEAIYSRDTSNTIFSMIKYVFNS